MMTWPVTQRFVFSHKTEQTVPRAKANSPLKAPVDVIVFSVGRLIVPFSCSSMVYSVRAFLGAGFFDELFLFFWGSSSDSTMSSSSSSSSDSDLRGASRSRLAPKSKKNHPLHCVMETSRVDGVKAFYASEGRRQRAFGQMAALE